ncbi:MAG: hypothetical protein ACUVSJ_10250 [Anaerolineae bacterium]
MGIIVSVAAIAVMEGIAARAAKQRSAAFGAVTARAQNVSLT